MATGTVKWFKSEKGIGFITSDDGSGDLFVGAQGLEDPKTPLFEGQRVCFEITKAPQGRLAAFHVKPL